MPEDASYVIQTGADAHDRLEDLARLFWPTTQEFLTRNHAFAVERFVDVGCGIGDVASRAALSGVDDALGIDVNGDVVTAAIERAEQHRSSASFRVAALTDLGRDDALCDFDAVYARCLLTHQSDPRAGLAAMLAATRPGGRVLVEDVKVAAVWTSPPSDAFTRHLELYVAAAHGLGARPDAGAELGPMLTELGATDVHVDTVQPMLRGAEDLRIHACTMEAIATPVIDQGLATADEVDALVAGLEAFATTPGAVATLPLIMQVSAQSPVD